VLDVDYGSTGTTLSQLISLINAETATTGVTALTTAQANNARGTCAFNEWLPTDLADAIVLNWTPSTRPTSSGLSQVFRFAWDFTSLTPQLLGESVKVRGAYAVPSPGALAVLGLGGLLVRRRR
jgi:MYXO-CTERM domain-containing protein